MEKQYQLIGPIDFKEQFAPKIGIENVRELFKDRNFPSVLIGERYYTTEAAAKEYLKGIGNLERGADEKQ